MNSRMARLLTRCYPPAWRERYGAEFAAFLEVHPATMRTLANVTTAAFAERIFPSLGGKMNGTPLTFVTVTKQPSAFLPMAMSLLALTLVLGSISTDIIRNGHVLHPGDEGAIAHLWQILIAGQIPILAFFAFKWLRKSPRLAFQVLAVQAGAVLANLAVVFASGLG